VTGFKFTAAGLLAALSVGTGKSYGWDAAGRKPV
jgi:hypothetical protein